MKVNAQACHRHCTACRHGNVVDRMEAAVHGRQMGFWTQLASPNGCHGQLRWMATVPVAKDCVKAKLKPSVSVAFILLALANRAIIMVAIAIPTPARVVGLDRKSVV